MSEKLTKKMGGQIRFSAVISMNISKEGTHQSQFAQRTRFPILR